MKNMGQFSVLLDGYSEPKNCPLFLWVRYLSLKRQPAIANDLAIRKRKGAAYNLVADVSFHSGQSAV